MELYGRKSFWSFSEEGQRCSQSPIHHHPHHPHTCTSQNAPEDAEPPRFSHSRKSAASAPLSPSSPCPGSPWAFSPLQCPASPPPSVLYHCLASMQRQEGNVHAIAISRGIVFTGSDSSRVRVWKQPDCVDRGFVQAGHGPIRSILAHGSTLFTVHGDRRVRAWTVSMASDARLRTKKLTTLPPSSLFPFHRRKQCQHRDAILCLALHHADGLLYTGSRDHTVKAWRLAEKACVDSFVAHDDPVTAMLVRQLDGCLFTSSSDGMVKIWRRTYGHNSHALTMVLKFQHSPVNALALSHGDVSCFLYSGSADGYVNVWEQEAMSGRYNHGGFLQGHRYGVMCLAAVGRTVLSGSEDTTIRMWRREKGTSLHTCVAVVEGHRGPVRCMSVSVEVGREGVGLLLYSASLDRVVKVWRIKMIPESNGEEEDERSVDGGIEDQEAVEALDMNPVLSPMWVEKKMQNTALY